MLTGGLSALISFCVYSSPAEPFKKMNVVFLKLVVRALRDLRLNEIVEPIFFLNIFIGV